MKHHELGARTIHLDVVAARLSARVATAEGYGQYAVTMSTEELEAIANDIREAAELYRAAHQELIAKGND